MNDVDEDTDAEKRLNERMATGGDRFPPRQTLLAPASLYLTAILESVPPSIAPVMAR